MLSAEEIDQFNETGYLVFDGLLPEERVAVYKRLFDGLVDRARSMAEESPHWTLEYDDDGAPIAGVLHKVQGVCVVEPGVLELASEPVILDRVAALVGDEVDVFGTKFFPKLPNGGTSTHWHQDNFYFGTESDRIVSCATYLEPADAENGCLRVVPGSHRAGIETHTKNPTGHGSWTEVDESKAVDVVCSAGTVVLFSANLLHGANDNHSERSSFRTAWHYTPGSLDLERFPRGGYADRHTVRAA